MPIAAVVMGLGLLAGSQATALWQLMERRIRGQREGTGEPGTRSFGMTSSGVSVPGVKELFGADAEKALGGLSADDFSKGLGYESWADYVTKTGVVEA